MTPSLPLYIPDDSSAESGEAAGRRPLPPLGVPHETVAGISISAFLLGVLLMAGVWLIHTKIGESTAPGLSCEVLEVMEPRNVLCTETLESDWRRYKLQDDINF